MRFVTVVALYDSTNMASNANFYLLCMIGLFPISVEAAQTRVELTSPVHPATVGGILAIQCQVWNMQEVYRVNLFRVLMNGNTEELTTKGEYDSRSSLGQRGFVAKRSFSGGSIVLFLTVIDISPNDQGKYLCMVHSLTDGKYRDIAEDSMTIEIYSFPDKGFPTCNGAPNKLTFNSKEHFILTCTSEKAFPTAQLDWTCVNIDNEIEDFVIRNPTGTDMVTSVLSITLDESYDGVIFECKMTSVGFPDRMRSCTIGPLRIARLNSDKTNIKSPNTNAETKSSNEMKDSLPSEMCNTPCKSEDQYTLLYWAVATVGTTILMFIFLTTTIMYCCKYHTMSAEVITAQNSFTSCDGSEPVYVSLQRRQPQERNSMFMSVEDPNNPGNKVLMPREVFDEFYKSLSLKKRESNQVSIYD